LKVAEAVTSGRYGYLTTDEYVSYLDGFQRRPQLTLKMESARRLHAVDELLENGFLVDSEEYRRWVAGHSARQTTTMDNASA
jgi:hypothetical protein